MADNANKTSADPISLKEFDKFIALLPFTPYLIPLCRNSKDPSVVKGESWKDEKYKLTTEQARELMKDGLNVGIVATGHDVVIFDLDNPEKYAFPKETLTVKTRSGKLHKYFLNDGSVKNADGKGQYAKCGEVRAEWKYVVCPGSYVPSDTADGDGVYRVIVEMAPVRLSPEELPVEFRPSITEDTSQKITPVNMTGSFRNQYGWSLEDIMERDEKLDGLLNNSDAGYASASEADMATLAKLLYWGYMEGEAVDILQHFRGREKLNREDYLKMTLSKIGKTDTIAKHVNVKTWKPKLKEKPQTSQKIEPEKQPEKPIFDKDIEQQIEDEVNRIRMADNQLEALTSHLDHLAAGEPNNKKALVVLCLSGKSSNPKMKQIILLKAEPGSGKSQLMQKLTQGYKRKDVGRFSAHALDYSNLEGFEILSLKELGSMDEEKQGISTVKFLSSDDQGYTVEITTRNEETGKWTTEQYKIPPITTISGTTRLQTDPQFERRAWLLGMDETPEQTKRIAEWKAQVEAQNAEKLLGFRRITDFEFSTEVYRRFIERFQFKEIVIPFPTSLLKLLGYEVLRVRGDMDKLLIFVTLYGQLNLKRLRLIRGDVYALTPEVAVEGLNIIIEPLAGMLSRIDERTRKVFDILKSIVDVKDVSDPSEDEQQPLAHEREVRYDRKGSAIDRGIRERIAVKLGKSESTVRGFFRSLENSGYVSDDGKKPKTFTLLYDVSEIETKLNGISCKIKSHDVLICEMEKETQEWCQKLLCNLAPVDNMPGDQPRVLSTEAGFHNPSLLSSQAALGETSSEHRAIRKYTNLRTEGDTLNG